MPAEYQASAPIPCAVILGGGLALGAYQAGVLVRLIDSGRFDIKAVAGSSIGAVGAAILAGNPPERWAQRLQAFWDAVGTDPFPFVGTLADGGFGRHTRNWVTVATNRLAGAANLFRPRWPGERQDRHPCAGLYSPDPLRDLLWRIIDFDRLNMGYLRFCTAACDVEAGEALFFDTVDGTHIGPDHLLASGSLLPAFSPTLIEGRLLADGGFAANAPLEPFLASDRRGADWPLIILVDLFAPDDASPNTMEAAVARSTDLQFAMQTRMRLAGLVRERALQARLVPEMGGADLFHLSYRPLPHEAGSEKTYDFSRVSLRDRGEQGKADADRLVEMLDSFAPTGEPGLRVHQVRVVPSADAGFSRRY